MLITLAQVYAHTKRNINAARETTSSNRNVTEHRTDRRQRRCHNLIRPEWAMIVALTHAHSYTKLSLNRK